jgi:phosphotransferase system enzyme I (PtsI)
MTMKELTGIPASQGLAIGPAFTFERAELLVECNKIEDPKAEWERFLRAKETAKKQLTEVYEQAKAQSSEEEAGIFQAHIMMLDDPELVSAVKTAVEDQHINVESSLKDTGETYAQMLEALDDEYLSARALDVRDIIQRLLRILMNVAESPAERLVSPSIILAKDLTPSDTIMLDKSCVLGFCTAEGGATSHTAILARSLGIPAIVGAGADVLDVKEGTNLILDGSSGTILVEPTDKILESYKTRQEQLLAIMEKAQSHAKEPAVTTDGHQVEVVANIGSVEGAKAALEAGSEGVGLLRSEFLYLERASLPSEEEQYKAYKEIADVFGKNPVILRSLDVGGDKEIPYIDTPSEANPFLGVRAVRLCFDRPELFKPQLRAALRASVGNGLRLMFPMIATVGEVRRAKHIYQECLAELKAEGKPAAEKMQVGIMVEIPAAAVTADQLVKEIDFFSIGTNDLSQYTMAADRTNAHVSGLASGFQPAVLRLIKQVIDASHAEGKWTGLCGELAGEPLAIPILLGLGLDEFSMNPPQIPIAKQLIRTLSVKDTQKLAEEALNLEDDEQVKALVVERFPQAKIG